jgi:Uma2 family endonuclease
MAAATIVSLSEYLNTTYRPDRDYLEGELEERNMGEQPHARVQGFLAYIFRANRDTWRVRVLPEQRVQVRAERFRIPDICVIRLSDPADPIIRTPPLLCIEILSVDDSLQRIQERVNDYASMGTQNIWVINPWSRIAYYATERGFEQPENGILRVSDTPIQVSLAEIFAELDEA